MAGSELLKNMACRLEERGAWEESVSVRADIASRPDADSCDQFLYARALLYAGRLDQAQRHIGDLPDTDPAMRMLKAEGQEKAGNHESACQLWAEALAHGGQPYWCLFGQARAHLQMRRIPEAIEIMKQALDLSDKEKQGIQFALLLQQALEINSSALTEAQAAKIQAALLQTYFKGRTPDTGELEDHTHLRFDACVGWFVPWLRRYADLSQTTILEVGCGTGSSTAALALNAKRIDAYDIDARSVDAARQRAQIMNIDNAYFYQNAPDNLLAQMVENHPPQTIDCVVLFAVLEHQLYKERIATLKTCWDLLRPGGLLVVADTPNRLSWYDFHTSWLPFFSMLPDDLAVEYSSRSSRNDLQKAISNARAISEETALNALVRLGRGVSYHEFEIALGEIEPFVLGDGFDPEPLAYFGVSLETRLLYTYKRRKPLSLPPAFVRDTLEVILQKPMPGGSPIKRRSLEEIDAIVQPMIDAN